MTKENFQKASQMQTEIGEWKQHRTEIARLAMNENKSLHFGEYQMPGTYLKTEFISGIVEDYLKKVDTKIATLEKEFSKI